MSDELDRFAERLIQTVRDRSIAACDSWVAGETRGPTGNRWNRVLTTRSKAEMRELLPDIIDQVLFELLDAIDNGRLPLGWKTQEGSFADLADLGKGEMGGWLMMGPGGWLDRFSRQRFVDRLEGLELKPDDNV